MGSIRSDITPDMTTVLRLPNMDSVMEEDIDDTEESESKRREPEHRRLNRLRLMKQTENDSPVTSPENNQAFSLNKEKTLVEILLRKYGFGQWKLPHEEGNEETPNQQI